MDWTLMTLTPRHFSNYMVTDLNHILMFVYDVWKSYICHSPVGCCYSVLTSPTKSCSYETPPGGNCGPCIGFFVGKVEQSPRFASSYCMTGFKVLCHLEAVL